MSPFNFLFLVKSRLNEVRKSLCTKTDIASNNGLCIKEGEGFTAVGYSEAFERVESSIIRDISFGSSRAKIVVVLDGFANCMERPEAPKKTVDIVYRIFSSDPLPAIRATPEERIAANEKPATETAAKNTDANYRIQPLFGYDHTRRGFGGGDVFLKIPGGVLDGFHLSGSGSSSSRLLSAGLDGSRAPHLLALDTAEYHLAYKYSEIPSSGLRLASGALSFRIAGTGKAIQTPKARTSIRYGASVEQGNQQSNFDNKRLPKEIIANSAYGAIRVYGGLTSTTRYSETAISYGLQAGGTGLANPNFTKHVGDASYSLRFPAGRHDPWDMQARFTSGGIIGSEPVLVNERFFGGNSVTQFIPGDSWRIANGPLMRSIAHNRLAGAGVGGTSFYSANLTAGKVIKYWPLVPTDIEATKGFSEGVNAAEATAQGFFADGYLEKSKEFIEMIDRFAERLNTDLQSSRSLFRDIRAAGEVGAALDSALKASDRVARRTVDIVKTASVPNEEGRISRNNMRRLINENPKSNLLKALVESLPALQAVSPSDQKMKLSDLTQTLRKDLDDLTEGFSGVDNGEAGKAARSQAASDMTRPSEIIATMRKELNRVSFGVVGIFDNGRVWPDPYGTRYAIGGGCRVSLININFTIGYAINPQPRKELGQGRGALFFSLTYTNLFR